MAIFQSPKTRALYVRAMTLLVGAIFTPMALGLSSAGLGMGGPILLYGGISLVMGYRQPTGGYLWGVFLAEGMLLAYMATGAALVAWQGWEPTMATVRGPFVSEHLPRMFVPAVVAAVIGGFLGSRLGRR